MSTHNTAVAVIGGGVVGTAIAHTLAHRGVDVVLIEAESDLAFAASGTNSGVLHTGFDSTPGELETELILRSARLRPAVLSALNVPVRHTGAVLIPHQDADRHVIAALAANAAQNGVEVAIRADDGALVVPGESITDPVAFTLALGRSAEAAGARILRGARVTAIEPGADGLSATTQDGQTVNARVVVNAAGLYADDIARMLGDHSFEIYPRKGEFFVFALPDGQKLEQIILPVPTKRTKGVLVFPTLDGHVVAGPTAHDQADKDDWSVRPEADREVLDKAVMQYPALAGLQPIAGYAGLRPAGRDANYVIAPSTSESRLINVAAIRSTGLSACLGIADYVADLLPAQGIDLGEPQHLAAAPAAAAPPDAAPWWQRTATKKFPHSCARTRGLSTNVRVIDGR